MIRVFLGYDSKETIAYHVACQSIHERSSEPVTIAPLMLSQVKDVFNRERNNKQSTEFSFSRFLVPYLCGFEGWAIFADCDILCLDDIAKLWALRDDKYAVMCVKHVHIPKEETKFLGQVQTVYEKKNWSSVMLMNTAKCKNLTAEYVNTASGLELHRFHWLESEDLIGELDRRWNFLVDYYDEVPGERTFDSPLHRRRTLLRGLSRLRVRQALARRVRENGLAAQGRSLARFPSPADKGRPGTDSPRCRGAALPPLPPRLGTPPRTRVARWASRSSRS